MLIRRSRQAPAPAIPTDYVFYARLDDKDATVAESGQTMTHAGSIDSKLTNETIGGIACIKSTNNSSSNNFTVSDAGFAIGNSARTISVWGCGTASPSNNGLLGWTVLKYGATSASAGVWFRYFLKGIDKAYGGYNVTYTYQQNSWHHYLVTYDGDGLLTFYVDGVSIGSVSNANFATTLGALYIFGDGLDGYWTGGLASLRIYNRCVTAEEIALLAGEFTPQYEITAQDLTFSLYQKNETYGISYTSLAGTPTFEIIEGTLPNTITFNTSTGQFTGKGLTDADHVYNLVVRLTAPNSTPATCNVTIHTYMTARISITGKTFTFYTDGSESSTFNYTSDEVVTFALESGSTLPSGITMSGNTFYSDGTTTTGSYSVVVRGTSQHNQTGVTATMYFTVTANVISITTTELKFYTPKGVTSKQVAYTTSHFNITPVYTLSGTLPSGVTFDSSTGTFTSDGTQSADETQSVSVTVASSTGLSTAGTGTISIEVYTTAPAIPEGYILYAPLKTDETPEVGTFVQKTNNWVFTTAPDGTLAAYNSDPTQRDFQLAGFNYTGSISSTDSMTCSIWSYCTRAFNTTPPDWLGLIGAGNKNGTGVFLEWNFNGGFEIPWISDWSSSDTTLRPTNNAWHHVLYTYERGGYLNIYVDGTLIWTSTSTRSINLGSNNLYVGTRYNDGRPWVGYLRNAVIYNRVLTSTEIQDIYSAGID